MEHAQKIHLYDTLGTSILCSTVQNRLMIRSYMLEQQLDKIVGSMTFDSSGYTFARNLLELLNSRGIIEKHLKPILELAISIEDHEPLKQKLMAIQVFY